MAPRNRRPRGYAWLDRTTFAKLGIQHVDAMPGQLERVLAFLWAWPRTAYQAVVLLRTGGEATVAECVCVRWRAVSAMARPPLAPVLDVSPDGRRCFSAPVGQPCGWFWLEGLLGFRRYGRATLSSCYAETWQAVHDGTFAARLRSTLDPDGALDPAFVQMIERSALREVQAARAVAEAQQRMWWGLDVETARDIAADLPVSCQVTLFTDRLYTATDAVEVLDLQLDMWRYHWLLMRARHPEERVYVSE